MLIKNIAVLFSGNGSNLENLITKLHHKTFGNVAINIKLLICNNPNAYGIERAQRHGLKTTIINQSKFDSREEFDSKLVEEIKKSGAVLTVLAGFMRILSPIFTKEIKAINLHPSILPLFKGANAISESFYSDMQIGGVSVHWVENELDSGKIIAQETFQRGEKNLFEWETEVHKIERELLPNTIVKILTKS